MREVRVTIENIDIEADTAYIRVGKHGRPVRISEFGAYARGEQHFEFEQVIHNAAVSVAMSGLEITPENIPAIVAHIEAQTFKVVA